MKLTYFYSNKENIFPNIKFREGFNVVFARVQDPTLREQDSHNLGKSFLIQVIDFALLSSIDNKHPFRKHPDRFSEFVFYLEVETLDNQFVTIRRGVEGRKTIFIHVCSQKHLDLRNLNDSGWLYQNLSLDKAKEIVDSLVKLNVVRPYSYRKGLGYVLRRQSDYDDIFKISKFRYGSDKNWKPFLAHILGLNREPIDEKYQLDDQAKDLESDLRRIEQEAGSRSEEYDAVRGEIEIKRSSIERLRREVENFSFREVEAEINEAAITRIEREISELNERRYIIDYELLEIERSIQRNFEFDIDKIREIFEEVSITFPDNLSRSYDELVEFNKRVSVGRIDRLRSLREKLIDERSSIEYGIRNRDEERQSIFAILQEREVFNKYKRIQALLISQEKDLLELEQRLSQLDRATNVQRQVENKQQEVAEKVQQIRESVYSENEIYSEVRRVFSEYVEHVLNVQALLSVTVNQHGNLDFNVRTLDRGVSNRETSESLGTSYKKILCACFDLTLVSVYASQGFYRFVYHDGIFEGLDNRKKVNLLDLIRNTCQDKGIQYILTVIDSDLPRNEFDNKLFFEQYEIVRELHDQDDSGRLFRMPAF